MQLLNEAFRAIQRNLGPLIFYICVGAGMGFIRILTNKWFESLDKETISPLLASGYPIASDILIAAGYAFALCIVFARMGREIDKPFWKLESDWEVLQRFYNLWFILILMSILALRVSDQLAADSPEEGQLVFFLWLFGNSFLIQTGGAIMFYGHCRKEEIALAASTLLRQFPLILLAALVSLFFNMLVLTILAEQVLPAWATPMLDIIDGYGTCLVFAFTWLICMRNRDEESEDEDFDF